MNEIIRKLNNRNIIKLSHALNMAQYDLGIVALDIVYTLVAQIKNEDKVLNTFQISVTELERRIGRKLNRKSLKKAQEELNTTLIRFPKSDNNDPFPWVEIFELDTKVGAIWIKLNTKLEEHLLNPKLFVMSNLDDVLSIKSQYVKRMYLLCSQFAAMKKFSIGIKPLNTMLSTPGSLAKSYGNFKERVLTPAFEIINNSGDMKIAYAEYKTGRFITDLQITVHKKEKEPKTSPHRKIKKGVLSVEKWLERKKSQNSVIDAEII